MNEQILLRTHVLERWSEIRARNPNYSLRSLARRTKVSSGALAEILKGKRNVSQKLATRLCDHLIEDPKKTEEILNEFRIAKLSKTSKKNRDPKKKELQLSADQFYLISENIHFAVLSLLKTKGFKNDSAWIAKRLGRHERDVTVALERLERLEIIKTVKGRILRTSPSLTTSDNIPSSSIRKAHRELLEKAIESLERHSVGERDIRGITMAVNTKKLPHAQKLLADFQDALSELLEDGSEDEVYHFSTQLFPLTQR